MIAEYAVETVNFPDTCMTLIQWRICNLGLAFRIPVFQGFRTERISNPGIPVISVESQDPGITDSPIPNPGIEKTG